MASWNVFNIFAVVGRSMELNKGTVLKDIWLKYWFCFEFIGNNVIHCTRCSYSMLLFCFECQNDSDDCRYYVNWFAERLYILVSSGEGEINEPHSN
jgi:hypothetical protein